VRPAGIRRPTVIDFQFLDSPEFADLTALYQELAVLGPPPYRLETGSETVAFNRLEDLAERVHEVGKKGLQIQRYKGLGEMNPSSFGKRRWIRRAARCCRCGSRMLMKPTDCSRPHGRPGGAAPRVYRAECAERAQPRRLNQIKRSPGRGIQPGLRGTAIS